METSIRQGVGFHRGAGEEAECAELVYFLSNYARSEDRKGEKRGRK
jgi:hypothetical protein